MAIFNRYSDEFIRENFTHYGWYLFCPIYIGGIDSDLKLDARNWVPEFVLTMAEATMAAMIWTASALFPDYEPQFAFYLTGEIEGDK